MLIIADLMAGAADYAVRVGSRFPDDTGSDWIGVAQAMTMQPVFRKLTLERPYEFPDLIKFFFRPRLMTKRRHPPVSPKAPLPHSCRWSHEIRRIDIAANPLQVRDGMHQSGHSDFVPDR